MWNSLLMWLASGWLLASAKPIDDPAVWWKNSVLYQIYPHSFKDSDGNGIGDLAGITSKLEHIAEVADIVWLSPIYPSPLKDFGYDISNFVDVNPLYGSLADFDKFVARAKELGLRVIMDLVPNHTSEEHEWFKLSVKRVKPYDEYYVWHDGKLLENGTRVPPNNWLQTFHGSMWDWNEERGQFYLHQFIRNQPDLNYRNPLVQEEMRKVMLFWLDRGVDGFRVDAIAHLFEDSQWRDEPASNRDVPRFFYDSLYPHNSTRDLDEDYNVVSSWRRMFDEYSAARHADKRVLFMEVGSALPFVMRYYSIDTDPFNFGFIHQLNNDSSAADFKRNIDEWMNEMPAGGIPNWIVGNHDVHRVASRFGFDNNRADQMSMISAVLPGVAIVYNGDEIGMQNRFFTYDETKDPAGCNGGPGHYAVKSRDPERTPFQWDDSVSAGFSSNPKTWLPVHDNYKSLNLKAQKEAEVSHYKVFTALKRLKQLPTLAQGSNEVAVIDDQVLAIVRKLSGAKTVALLVNFAYEEVIVDAGASLGLLDKMSVAVASVKSGIKPGELVDTKQLVLPGAASIIIIDAE